MYHRIQSVHNIYISKFYYEYNIYKKRITVIWVRLWDVIM